MVSPLRRHDVKLKCGMKKEERPSLSSRRSRLASRCLAAAPRALYLSAVFIRVERSQLFRRKFRHASCGHCGPASYRSGRGGGGRYNLFFGRLRIFGLRLLYLIDLLVFRLRRVLRGELIFEFSELFEGPRYSFFGL